MSNFSFSCEFQKYVAKVGDPIAKQGRSVSPATEETMNKRKRAVSESSGGLETPTKRSKVKDESGGRVKVKVERGTTSPVQGRPTAGTMSSETKKTPNKAKKVSMKVKVEDETEESGDEFEVRSYTT